MLGCETYADALLRANVWRGLLMPICVSLPGRNLDRRDNWLYLRALLADTLDPLCWRGSLPSTLARTIARACQSARR